MGRTVQRAGDHRYPGARTLDRSLWGWKTLGPAGVFGGAGLRLG
jgi:hypothetical protein